jgi:hypothetical protein
MRFCIHRHLREEAQHYDDQGARRQVRLNPVPRHRDQTANHRRYVCAEHTKSQPADNRVRHRSLLARPGYQVGDQLHNANTREQGDQHLPAGQPKGEQAGGEYIAADAVHVAHPKGENVVPRPFLRQWAQVLVVQARAVAFGQLFGHRLAPRNTGLRSRNRVHTGGGMVCIRGIQQNACQWHTIPLKLCSKGLHNHLKTGITLSNGAHESCTQSIAHPMCTQIADSAARGRQKRAPGHVHDRQACGPALQRGPIAQIVGAIGDQPQ